MRLNEWPSLGCVCVEEAGTVTKSGRYVFYEFRPTQTAGTPLQAVPAPVVYVGHERPNAYPTEASYDEVPYHALKTLREEGYTPVTGVSVNLADAEVL